MDATTTGLILMTCACGKRLRAGVEKVGKRLKCPGCGAAVTVPAPHSNANPPAPSADQNPVAEESRTRLDGLSPDYRIRLAEWIAAARPHFSAVLGPSILYLILYVLISMASLFLSALAYSLALGIANYLPVFVAVPGLLMFAFTLVLLNASLIPILAVGFHVVCQAQLKGESWGFGTFFRGFRWIWPLSARAVLLILVEVVPLLPALLVYGISNSIWQDPPALLAGPTTALLIGGYLLSVYLLVRLVFFSHHLIIDRGCRPIEAFKGSWNLSRGHFWGLFGTLLAVFAATALIGILTLGIGLLFALPALVLMLNAGYLLIAGSKPLAGMARDSERTEPHVPLLPIWLVPSGVLAALMLIALGVSLVSYLGESQRAELFARRRIKDNMMHAKRAEQDKIERARAKEEAEQQSKEMVACLRAGGSWSFEVLRRNEREFVPEAGGKGGGPPGIGGKEGGSGGAATLAPYQVIVVGPSGFLKAKPAVRFGIPSAPRPELAEVLPKFEDLAHADLERRREFYRQFAVALDRGEVEAVLIEMPRQSQDGGGAGKIGGGGGGPGGFGGGEGPVGGDKAAWDGLQPGTAVPLDMAMLLSRERFLALADPPMEQR